MVLILYGEPAVGKLTIAKALAKKTGYIVMDNHSTIDLVIKFFAFNTPPFNSLLYQIRMLILKEIMQSDDYKGIIWTTALPNIPSVHLFYKNLQQYVRNQGGSVQYIHIRCSKKEQNKRVTNKSRCNTQKIHNTKDLKKILEQIDFSPGDMLENSLSIDNTFCSIESVVNTINNCVIKPLQ